MKRWGIWGAGVVAVGAAVGLAVHFGFGDADARTAKEIMVQLNKPPQALTPRLVKELMAPEPDWPAIQKDSEKQLHFTQNLAKAEPPRGSRDSWENLTKEYAASAQTVNEEAQKKDKTAALAAQKQLQGACARCHKAHKS